MHPRNKKASIATLGLISSAAFLVACGGGGGGGGGDSATATGYFKDASVRGLHYVSGGQSGETGAGGSFTYEVGSTVTFSIGGVELGSATGAPVVTPIDLVTGGNSASNEVKNRVRFLIALDDDGDRSNGITIPAAVATAAADWTTPDFSATETAFGTAMTSLLSDAATAGATGTLPTALEAQDHLEATVRCAYSGAFKGTFSGDDHGQFGIMVDAVSGEAVGIAYSTDNDMDYALTGGAEMNYSQDHSFVSGSVIGGDSASFEGDFASANAMSGTWSSGGGAYNGTFNGNRVGGSATAQYRFTGQFSGSTDAGLFSIDVDGSNKVTGVAYSVIYDEQLTITGSVDASGTIAAQTSNGTQITGTLNKTTGDLLGEWESADSNDYGNYSGAGCRLN